MTISELFTCLVSTLVYAYLVRLINNPITTKKPPLDGGRMAVKMVGGVVK